MGSGRTALIAGATGLVGEALVHTMLDHQYYDKIKLLVRKPTLFQDDRIEEILLEDFDEMESVGDQLFAHDVYCALGTTMKKAGSKEKFRKIDLEYPFMLAEISQKSEGFEQFLVVTAAGADASSSIYYNQVKGELEEKLKALSLRSLKIFRPTLLLGERDEFRLGEWIAQMLSRVFSFFLVGLKGRLWYIKATDVAKAVYAAALDNKPGSKTYSSHKMIKLIQSQGL